MNMNNIVGQDNLLFLTLDTLRYDVAQTAWREGSTPNLAERLPVAERSSRRETLLFGTPSAEPHQAEASRIVVGQLQTGIEAHADVIVQLGRRIDRLQEQGATHPEVRQQRVAAREPKDRLVFRRGRLHEIRRVCGKPPIVARDDEAHRDV